MPKTFKRHLCLSSLVLMDGTGYKGKVHVRWCHTTANAAARLMEQARKDGRTPTIRDQGLREGVQEVHHAGAR